LIATMACLVAILFAFGYFYNSIAQLKQASKEKLEPQQQQLTGLNNQIDTQMKKLRVAQAEALELSGWLEDRAYWGRLLMELRDVMIRTERAGKEQFKTDTGIWIEKFSPDCAGKIEAGSGPAVAAPPI